MCRTIVNKISRKNTIIVRNEYDKMLIHTYIYIYIPQNVIAHNVSIHLKQMATYKEFIGMCQTFMSQSLYLSN
jgi:hypothetical protein